jgi:long-chain acyl-CoA synthetase
MVEPLTLPALFRATVAEAGDAPALRELGRDDLSWNDFGALVTRWSHRLADLGVGRGDTVALITRNTPEFHVADMACAVLGAVPYSITDGDPVDRAAQVLSVAGTRTVIADPAGLPLARALPAARVLTLGAEPADGEIAVDASDVAEAEPIDVECDELDVATLIFTSGSTGTPKAVQLPHRAVLSSVQAFHLLAPYRPDDVYLSYLPLSHIAERFMTYYSAVAHGGTVVTVRDPSTFAEQLATVRPTRFFGVPRIWERIAERVRALVGATPELAHAHRQAAAALSRSSRITTADRAGIARWTDDLAPVRATIGLDRARYLGVATAPSSRALLEYLAAAGLLVGDVWGMSEAIMCTANPVDDVRLGTVGRFLDGVQGRIADDGEILVTGRNTFLGYRGDPERTAELRDDEGWLHTGDLGSIDDGYLTILGRRKEVMITAGGLNILPGVVETAIKDASPLIDAVLAIADGRRYVTALIALDPAQLAALAAAHGRDGDHTALSEWDLVQDSISDAIRRGNEMLAHGETVRRWAVAGTPWLPGGDELTVTLKLRRREIAVKYADLIDALYD